MHHKYDFCSKGAKYVPEPPEIFIFSKLATLSIPARGGFSHWPISALSDTNLWSLAHQSLYSHRPIMGLICKRLKIGLWEIKDRCLREQRSVSERSPLFAGILNVANFEKIKISGGSGTYLAPFEQKSYLWCTLPLTAAQLSQSWLGLAKETLIFWVELSLSWSGYIVTAYQLLKAFQLLQKKYKSGIFVRGLLLIYISSFTLKRKSDHQQKFEMRCKMLYLALIYWFYVHEGYIMKNVF